MPPKTGALVEVARDNMYVAMNFLQWISFHSLTPPNAVDLLHDFPSWTGMGFQSKCQWLQQQWQQWLEGNNIKFTFKISLTINSDMIQIAEIHVHFDQSAGHLHKSIYVLVSWILWSYFCPLSHRSCGRGILDYPSSVRLSVSPSVRPSVRLE